MNYQVEILSPSPTFQPYIEYYKNVITDAKGVYKCVPNTNQELYFNFKQMQLWSGSRYFLENPDVYFGGLHGYEQNAISTLGDDVSGGFVIVLKPSGMQNLFHLSNSELLGYAVDGENIFRNSSELLWQELKNTTQTYQKKRKVESFLYRFVEPAFTPSLLMNLVFEKIKREKGMLSTGKLSRLFYLTPRSLQRRFKDQIGMSPKEYLQITRLNYALELIQKNNTDTLTQISYLSGYYDQSHFIKDIKKICEFSPGELSKNTKHIEHCDNRNFLKLA